MPIKYIPYLPNTVEGQALLNNFTRTRRLLRYRDNDKVFHRIKRGMPWYETNKVEQVGDNDKNLIIHGECISACAYLKEQGKEIDLVYIDPPFASGADYAKKVYLRRNPKLTEKIKQAEQTLEMEELQAFEEKMYGDIWRKEDYLNWMYENLMAIKSVMSETASIYVHLDWHIGHYVKILLDEVFGEDNFVNEIIWRRKQATSFATKQFGVTNDTLYWYCKSDEYIFNPEYSINDKNTQKYLEERFIYDDGDGRKYMKSPLVNSLYRPNLKYTFHGIEPPYNGWLYKKEKLEELYKKNEIVFPKNGEGRIYRKIYEDTYKGQLIQNIWLDIPIVNPMAKERLDYATQKPEALLERIIKASSAEGMVVADFFGGSGVAAKVAHDLEREFIHCDVNINSIQTARDRLMAAGAEFRILEIKDGVRLFRNPVQTMDKLARIIPGLQRKVEAIPKFWFGALNDSKKGTVPVYVPNLLNHEQKVLDIPTMNRIINEEFAKLPDTVEKVIVYYIDIEDRKELEEFMEEVNATAIKIELRDLKNLLHDIVVEDEIEFTCNTMKLKNGDLNLLDQAPNKKYYCVEITKFVSDRLNQAIDTFNEKGHLQAMNKGKKFTPIEISETGLELIEMIAVDCENKAGQWHSTSEIKINKLGYISINGKKTKEFWNGKIFSEKKPLRLKIRNISGDESVKIVT